MSLPRRLACLLVLSGLVCAREASAVNCEALRANDADYVVCRVDLAKDRLQLAYADAAGARFGSFEALRDALAQEGRKLTFAMNAGMFHPDFSPVGLLVVDGRTVAPINRGQGTGNFFLQPNGVFMLDADARVLATHEFRAQQPRFATQSGPMLLHLNQVPSNFAFRANSTSRHIRNGVCVPAPGTAAFVISDDPVSFFEFARFFQQQLRCTEALYLDGSISSLYSAQLGRSDRRATLGPMFAVSE
jgi:uncharacterized protein YigE (DUF2233 family)